MSASQTSDRTSSARAGSFDDLQREILSGFRGRIEPVQVPLPYRLGILLVATVMVVLPLVYVAIIGLVGYGVYYHAVNHTALIGAGRGRGALMALLIYLAPMIIGPILVLFMFKPLLSRPAKRDKPESLDRDDEPLIFAFVERICEAVGAPKPTRIDVDCQVNASASYRRGLWSMLGNDLVLTIGMPLAAGLTLRQLAGVMAHEFGHFSQGAGMRLTYIIRSISHWFTRVVYERDEWDQKLVEWSESIDMRVGWVLYLARLFVWLTRKVLWALMIVGHAVSGYLLRQMEFDADRHEARLAGSDVFASTVRRLMALNVATQGAHSDLDDFYREGRLADDLPKLIMHNIGQFPPDVATRIDEVIEQSETGLFDTHPCDKDRIASARREDAPGIFHVEMPAEVLFRDFPGQCRRVTWSFYQQVFGAELAREKIHRIDELLARQEQEHSAYKALRRYFQDAFSVQRPLRVARWEIQPVADGDQTVVCLKQSREEMLTVLEDYKRNVSHFEEATPDQQGQLADALQPFEVVAAKRLWTALALLHLPDVAERIDGAPQWIAECAQLIPRLQLVNRQIVRLAGLASANARLADLLNRFSNDREDEGLIRSIRQQMELVSGGLLKVRDELESVSYPFDHAKQGISLGEFALPELPDGENPIAIYQAADTLLGNLHRCRARLTGQLCIFAEQVESALGLDPLSEPVDEMPSEQEAALAAD